MHTMVRTFHSVKLDRDIPFKRYGHAGKPMIVFPTADGRFHEFEDFGMIEACRPFIENGVIRVYAIDSIDRETWLNVQADPVERARIHNAYDACIVDELVPAIKRQEPWSEGFLTAGCDMGAFHAANFFFKHPDVFDTLIALSGYYDTRAFVGDRLGEFDIYVNSPIDYLKHLSDPWYLERYRTNSIVLCTGQGEQEARSIRDTRQLESILRDKGIPAWVDYWGYDVNHDWSWWRLQIAYFLGTLIERRRL